MVPCDLKNTGLLSYADVPNGATFYYKICKEKEHSSLSKLKSVVGSMVAHRNIPNLYLGLKSYILLFVTNGMSWFLEVSCARLPAQNTNLNNHNLLSIQTKNIASWKDSLAMCIIQTIVEVFFLISHHIQNIPEILMNTSFFMIGYYKGIYWRISN